MLAAASQATSSQPLYKNPHASIDDRVSDLLKRMSVQEKMAQLIQGDMSNYLDLTYGTFNKSGLVWNMEYRANSVWTGYYTNMTTVKKAAQLAQDYLLKETELGQNLTTTALVSSARRLTPSRHSGVCSERRSSWVLGPECHDFQLSHWCRMLVQSQPGRDNGKRHCNGKSGSRSQPAFRTAG